MATAMTIRAARIAERCRLEALQRRASLAWDQYRDALLSHPEAIALPAEHIRQKRVFVAECDGKIVGFAVVLPRNDDAAELEGLFVEPKYWRRGIGSRLIRHAERTASDAGFASLHVVAAPPAWRFYAACGFELIGEEQTRFGKALSMRKSLAVL